MTRVVVIGGGIAGLAAALAVLTAGRDVTVTVIEAGETVGGKLRISDVAGIAVDEGAEMFLRRVPEGLDLVDGLGRTGELASPRTMAAQVWARGELRAMPTGTVMGLPSDPSRLRGVLTGPEVARASLDRVLPGAPPQPDISVGDWVARRMGHAVVERLVDPLLGGVYAGRAHELSLAATVPQLSRDHRSVQSAVRAALPPTAASSTPVFATLTAGMGSLPVSVAAAVEAQGGEIVTGRAARRLERTASGWRVVHGATNDEQAVEADAVIVAVPAAAAARLFTDVASAAAAELGGIEAASMAIVTTAWAPTCVPPLATSGYLVPAVYGRPVKAVTFSSSKWAHLAAPDVSVVRCSIGRYGDVRDLQLDDAELVAAAVRELTAYSGFTGVPIDSRVSRWGGALPQYAVGHLDRVARIRSAVASTPGLAVCGATYDGVGVPACIRTARAAAKQVLASLTIPGSR